MKYVTNECLHCGGRIEFPLSGIGEWIECPHCQERIQLKKPALLARLLSGANPGGTWAIILTGAMVSATALFIYFDHRGEAREHDRQQAAAEKVRLDLLARQDRAKESSASERAQADQSARAEAMLKSLQKDIEDLRETNALLVSRLANQQNAPKASQGTVIAPPQSPRRIRVYEIISGFGSALTRKCRTDIGEIWIPGLPKQVEDYLAQVSKLKAEEAEFRAKVESYDQAARRASAVTPTGASGDPASVQAVMNQRAQANLMLEDARDAKAALAKMQANLSAWERVEEEGTTILAVPGRPGVWNYVSMAATGPSSQAP